MRARRIRVSRLREINARFRKTHHVVAFKLLRARALADQAALLLVSFVQAVVSRLRSGAAPFAARSRMTHRPGTCFVAWNQKWRHNDSNGTARACCTPVAAATSSRLAGVDDSGEREEAGLKADFGRCCCTCSKATWDANRREDSRDMRSFDGESLALGL